MKRQALVSCRCRLLYLGVAHVFTVTGREVFTANLRGTYGATGQGGPPVIADFDGDGRLEIGVAGATAYNVLDPDCRGTVDGAVVVDDTGTGSGIARECREDNNVMLVHVACP